MARATDAQIEQWRSQGWVLIPGLVDPDEIDRAEDELWSLFPSPEEFHAGSDGSDGASRRERFLASGRDRHRFGRADDESTGAAFRERQFLGRQQFPLAGCDGLNRLVVHDHLLDLAERALGSDDVRLYQMGIWAKYTGITNYEQPMHQDQNHSVVPFRAEPGWWHLEGFLYLTDVDEGVAPTRVVGLDDSGHGRQATRPLGPDDEPELYRHEVSAAGPRGSYLAYRPDVFHRGVDLVRPGGFRVLYNISYRLAGQDWIGFENHQRLANTASFRQLVAGSTPRQLAALGVPRPGHLYWTPAMVEAMADRYPDLDLTPWREALTPKA